MPVLHSFRARCSWGTATIASLLFTFSFVLTLSGAAQVKQTRRVLVFNDFGAITSPGIAEMDYAIATGLERSSYKIELYNENLEVTLFPDELSQRRLREEYARKYSDRKPNLIITVGPASLRFLIESRERFFPDIPVIFCGGTEDMLGLLKPDAHFTGVWVEALPEKTLDAAVHMLPRTQHVTVVGGVGSLDREEEAIIEAKVRNYNPNVDFTYLTDLAMPALLEQLKELPSNTIVLHTAITQDAAGTYFIDATQSVPLVASAANAPVFAVDDVDVGNGTVGGDVVSWAAAGQLAAVMALRVLNGDKPQDIPITKSNNVYMFDWRALRRWGIREGSLPSGSIVLNRQPTFWELYWRYVITGIFLLFAQTLVILGLLWQRAERRKTQTELIRSHGRLRESEGRFRLVANTAPVMIWMSGIDKSCTYVNQGWLDFTGRANETELENGWTTGIHPEDLERSLETYTQAFDRRAPFQMEYRLRRKDGEYRWIFDQGVPRFSGDGSFAGYIGSAIDITERKLAEETLSTVSQRLIEGQEQERSRIARELHDDINQKLALLGINLERVKQGVPDSAAGLIQRIEETSKQIADIGADIQALSHRLHSSKLEYLGLTAAAKSFCREFSDQQKVEISFQSENVPKELPQEISVCLFRVLQEALQNATKHSGSRRFHVSLRDGTNQIELLVHDSGRGFDVEETIKGQGLGLTSMKERLKLVNGQLSIDSQSQRGTTIRARVPLNTKTESAGAVG